MFEKGDIITGKPGNGYGVTTNRAIMEVLSVSGKEIKVKVIDHKNPEYIGDSFLVTSKKFVLVDEIKGEVL